MKKSDIILVNLKDIRKSIGTCIEIYEAYKSGIPIIGFINEEALDEELINLIYPWIYCCINRIETGIDSMVNACNYIINYYG